MNGIETIKQVLADATPAKVWDEVGEFWVVTKPTKLSVIEDILFKTDVVGMARQFMGGLNKDDIVGILKSGRSAKALAEETLRAFKASVVE